MALMSLPHPIDRTKPGYGLGQEIPISGGTLPPMGSTDAHEDPADEPINTWLKAQPWFQAAMRAWGTDPNHPSIGISQRYQIMDAARRAGLQFGSSHDIGPNGDWEDVHTTTGKVIAATIGGIAGGAALAPVIAGAAAGGGGATAAGGVGLGETGATVGGLTSTALPGAVAAPVVGDLATVGSSIAGQAGTTAAVGGTGSTLGRIANALGTGTSLAGQAVSGATQAAGQTQLENARLGLTANQQNINGQSAFENELMARAKEEAAQRSDALKNVYRQSIATHPNVSPYNPNGAPQYSQAYLDTLGGLEQQGSTKLTKPAQYDTNNIAPLAPYTPYNPNTMTGPGGTQPSTLQTVGNWLGPTLSTIGAIAKLYGK